jgi:DNA polymerase-1
MTCGDNSDDVQMERCGTLANVSSEPVKGGTAAHARTLLLLDGHSLAYRAFYALPVENFSTSTGQPTNAIYGFASMLINLLAQEKPDQVVVAFDVSRKTFRTERFPEYKANRARSPEEFRSQLSFITEMLEAFQIQVIEREGYEADDLIATLARLARERELFTEVLITSGDRDSFQLIKPGVTVLYPKKGVTELSRMDTEAVIARYGLTPLQYPDFAALRGDPSDNLPSIPGVGEKTATKWIQEHGSLTQLVKDADQIGGKAGESLRTALSQVLLNRELTHLVDDVPMDHREITRLIESDWEGINSTKVLQLFDDLEIKTLKGRIEKLPSKSEMTANLEAVSEPEISVQLVSELVLASYCVGEVALIFSTNERFGPAIAISPREGEVFWAEVTSIDGFLKQAFEETGCQIFGHGLKERIRTIDEEVSIPISFDSELAAYLLNPGQREIDIETLVRDEFGYTPASNVTQSQDLFSEENFDPALTSYLWPLRKRLEGALKESEQLELFQRIELPLSVILARMEHRGIGFDLGKAEALRNHYLTEVRVQSDSAFTTAGHQFNVNSPKQLQVILFDELNLPKTKKIKSGYSTDADSLQWLYSETQHPILTALLRIREVSKLASIIDGLVTASQRGRIHTTFQQTITATGRLSSIDPNLQNIPIRSDEGRKIRDCFIARRPYEFLMTADYSQIEMRIMAHLSKDAGLIEAFASGEDLHNTVGARVFGISTAEVTPEMRRIVKAMSYGLAYGLSAYGLAQQLDLSPGEAQKLMDDYFVRFGGIREYLQDVVQEARVKGYTETLLGRRRYLPDLLSDNRQRREMAERMALNAPIQGSAADIIKLAMLALEAEIHQAGLKSRMILQVHDELILEVAPGEREVLEAIVRKAMGGAFPLEVALEVNVGVGESWESAAH